MNCSIAYEQPVETTSQGYSTLLQSFTFGHAINSRCFETTKVSTRRLVGWLVGVRVTNWPNRLQHSRLLARGNE